MRKQKLNISTFGAGGDPGTVEGDRRLIERHAVAQRLSRKTSALFPKFHALIQIHGNWGVREKAAKGYGWQRPRPRGRQHTFAVGVYGNQLDKLSAAEDERQTFLVMLLVITDALKRLGREAECVKARRVIAKLGPLPSRTPFVGIKQRLVPVDIPPEPARSKEYWLTLSMRTAGEWPTKQESTFFRAVESQLSRELKKCKCGEIDDRNWGGGSMELSAVGPRRRALRASMQAVLKGIATRHGLATKKLFKIEAT